MSFRAVLSRASIKVLDSLDRPTEQRLRNRIKQLANDPFDPRLSKPLTQPTGYRSSRVGDWRIVFTVNTKERLVQILSVEPRGQVYHRL